MLITSKPLLLFTALSFQPLNVIKQPAGGAESVFIFRVKLVF